jgi:hypothetical protein
VCVCVLVRVPLLWQEGTLTQTQYAHYPPVPPLPPPRPFLPPPRSSDSATKVIKVSSAFGGATIPKYCDMGQAPDGSEQRADCGNDPYQIDPDKSAYVDRGGYSTMGGPGGYSGPALWCYVVVVLWRYGFIGLLKGCCIVALHVSRASTCTHK